MNNRRLWTIAVALGMLGLLAGAIAADALVDVYVDGNKQSFDPGARLRAGTTYAPLRAAVEAVGASVEWVEAEQLAVVQKGQRTANIKKSQGIIVAGRLLIPLRLMAEALEIEVAWDSSRKAVMIGKPLPPAPRTSVQQSTGSEVFITSTGKKYHRANCRYLRQSKIPISLSDAKKRGYTPCKVCKPPH